MTITSPTAALPVPAGNVTIRGTVNAGLSTDTTTVLYVVDASGSTQTAASCGNANGDTRSDVLDCEIGAVKVLNTSLTTGRLETGLEAFAESAAVASLQTPAEGLLPFAPPGYTGGFAEPRLNTVADSVRLSHLGKFVDTDLVGHGTDFKVAIHEAVLALSNPSLPAGPKFVMFLSDGGKNNAEAPDLAELQSSGIHLRSFDLSAGATSCTTLMTSIASATGEGCVAVPHPDQLSAQLSGSQQDSVSRVTVTIGGISLDAVKDDPFGGWSRAFVLGQGSYAVKATASLTSVGSVSTTGQITVTAAPNGPAPGSVNPGAGSLLASKVRVNRPSSSRHRLPAHVTGAVGSFGSTPVATSALNGATVLLQGRSRVGATFVTVAKANVTKGGYSLTWKRKSTIHDLQVKLVSFGGFSGSTASVPVAAISACKVHTRGSHRTLTCHTIAKTGTKARVLSHGHVLGHTKVSKGLVTVSINRKFAGTVLKVFASKAHPFSLHL